MTALASAFALQAAGAASAQATREARQRMLDALKPKRGRGGRSKHYPGSTGYQKPASQVWREHWEPQAAALRAKYQSAVGELAEHRRCIRAADASVASAAGAGLVSCSTTLTTDNRPEHVEVFGVPVFARDKVEFETAKVRIRKTSRAVMKGTDIHQVAQAALFDGRRSATIMATMTYRPGEEPEAEDVTKCLRFASIWFSRKYRKLPKDQRPKLRYVWVAELTKKGRLHYHVLFFLPPMVKLPKFDVAEWWPKGSTRLEWARCANSYMAKYASKGSVGRGSMPKGFRMHGCGGLTPDERNQRRYHMAPSWVREFFTLVDRPRPCPGGGWLSQTTGEVWPSPYEILSAAAGRVTVRIRSWFIDSNPLNYTEQFA